MKTMLKTSVQIFLLTGILSGCKSSPPISGEHPTKLASLIADADHIVITNRLGTLDHAPPSLANFSLTVSGDQARNIIEAVTTARLMCAPPCTDSIFAWDLQFYRETHFLSVVHMQGSDFVFGDVNKGEEYVDDSGVLKRLDRNLYKRTGSQF